MNLYQMLWCFVVYGFWGWCIEVAYSAMKKKVFINRGFLNGPFCPIYGFSIICVTEILAEHKSNILLLYVLSVVLVTVIEWIVGFLLEKIFHQKWWDYSEEPLNIKGYICVPFSMAWGVGCVIAVWIIQPILLNFIDLIPHNSGCDVGSTILCIIFTMLVIDLSCMIKDILKLNHSLKKMEKIRTDILNLSNSLGESISQNIFEQMEKQENIKLRIEEKKKQYKEIFVKIKDENRRIFNAFPSIDRIKDKVDLYEKR